MITEQQARDCFDHKCIITQTCVMLNVADLVLHFILYRNVFPRCKENPLVHLSIFSKENVHWNEAAEVEHVDAVLDGHL